MSFIKTIIYYLLGLLSHKIYSQEGEDLILKRIFGKKRSGNYIDIGAHHPIRFSNTYYFYKRGWRGINIEPMPGSSRIFNFFRPKDVNIEIGVSEHEGSLAYHVFSDKALNTFDAEISKERLQNSPYRLKKIINLKTAPLKIILDQHCKNPDIDFMTIDVEGFEIPVLKSNDWLKYRPKIILVEILFKSLDEIKDSSVHQFLQDKDYVLFAKTYNTCFYKDANFHI